MKIRFSTDTLKGPRTQNEDSSLTHFLGKTASNLVAIIAIADGMGGMNAGEIASQTAINELKRIVEDKANSLSESQFKEKSNYYEIINYVNDAVLKQAAKVPERRGMGTTLVCAFIFNKDFVITNVGDSRAYLVQKEKIYQLSEDHSALEEYKKKHGHSDLSKAPALFNDALTKYLGMDADVEPDVFEPISVKEGNVILLCSDGVSKFVDQEQMWGLVYSSKDLNMTTKRIVQRAFDQASNDNMTMAATEFGNVERKYIQDQNFTSAVKNKNDDPPKKKKILPIIFASVAAIILLIAFLFLGPGKIADLKKEYFGESGRTKVLSIKSPLANKSFNIGDEVIVSWIYKGSSKFGQIKIVNEKGFEKILLDSVELIEKNAAAVKVPPISGGISRLLIFNLDEKDSTWVYEESKPFEIIESQVNKSPKINSDSNIDENINSLPNLNHEKLLSRAIPQIEKLVIDLEETFFSKVRLKPSIESTLIDKIYEDTEIYKWDLSEDEKWYYVIYKKKDNDLWKSGYAWSKNLRVRE